ncbi:hypothetical protein [Alkaliphilus transvaalensis]|uniref:hypothetical protein n=1 Tax=Alkaliphilus transvaalensis TaxID=114628 RepID=UPI00047E3594|nr:hypothetical protein [Alkaliphilus transvaalensis]
MKTISSQDLNECLKYTYSNSIASSEYASFIRYLIMTMKKEMAIEVLNNEDDTVIKGQIFNFNIEYREGAEGEHDNINFSLKNNNLDEEQFTYSLMNIGKEQVSKDSKSSPKTFYRFYLYPESNEEGYRITFNRRVTKK